jgi:serine/threonine-protein kinase RsbT
VQEARAALGASEGLVSAALAAPPRRPILLACADPRDRFACSSAALGFAIDAGLDRATARAFALCAAELASNAARHGGGGTMLLRDIEEPRPGIEIVCSDAGPGIADPAAALADGWSRGRPRGPEDPRFDGLGAGLGAVVRLADELEIGRGNLGGALLRARIWL